MDCQVGNKVYVTSYAYTGPGEIVDVEEGLVTEYVVVCLWDGNPTEVTCSADQLNRIG